MISRGILTAFLIVCCLLPLSWTVSSATAQSDPGLACTVSATPFGAYSASISGTVSGGVEPYHWTLTFGDGGSAHGTIGVPSGSYAVNYSYPAKGLYTVNFAAVDSRISSAADTCNVSTQVTILGPVQVNATLSDSMTVSDAALATSAQALSETIHVSDAASSPPATVLRETIGLVDNAAHLAQNLLTEVINLLESTQASSASTSSATTANESSPPGGGTTPFPVQIIAVPVIGGVLVISYLIIRWFQPRSVRR